MRVILILAVLAVLLGAVTAHRPLRKTLKPALLEKHSKKAKTLPHPTQFYRYPKKEGKLTPGKACHDYTSCDECAGLHICVWTVKDGEGKCLDERNPDSVYGSREACDPKKDNGYKDVKSRKEAEVEEIANMVGDADMKPDALGGDRVVVHAVDVDVGDKEPAPEDKEKLTNTRPKWAKNMETSTEVWKGYDGTKVTTTRKSVKTTKGGMPHEAPPASGVDAPVDVGETGQEDPTEGSASASAAGDGSAAAEEAQFRSKREDGDDLDHLHQKYHKLQERVASLEDTIAKHHGGDDDDDVETLPPEAGPEPSDSSDELEDQKEEDEDEMEYVSVTPEPKDNFKAFEDPEATGEHEPIVKEVTVTKITKNDEGEVVGQPETTKEVEELDSGTTDPDP